jgi:N-acetylneuraminic acid mutarotase
MAVGQVGNLIVAAYGFDSEIGDTRTTRIYDIDHDAWRSGSPAPRPTRSEGTAVTHGGFVYAIGGRQGTVLANIDRYSPVTNSWVRLPDMTTARAGLASAVVGNAIYVIGGRTGTGGPCSQQRGGQLATVERFDIVTGTWSTVAPLPTPRSDLAAIAVGGKIFTFGGCTVGRHRNVTFLHSVDVYDPQKDSWSTAPADMPTARAGLYQVAAVGDRVYVMGGWAGGRRPLAVNEVYNVATDSWTISPSMLTPRGEMGVVSHGGRLYTVGGSLPAFGASSNANDVFRP